MIRAVLVSLLIAAVTVSVYRPVTQFDFVDLDDAFNITTNPHVQEGLTPRNIYWALTTSYGDYWHPMMWISLQADCTLHGGVDSGSMHATNLALHVIAALLMFAVLNAMTGAFWPSAAVAAWFALHPMHVESVAWVTERKDVLSAVFWLLTMWAYLMFVRRGGWAWYALTGSLLALGLMSKPILVTLPFVLLLLDYWPLRRLEWTGHWQAFLNRGWRLALEKVPFMLLAAGSCAITYLHGSKATADISIRLRIANAAVSYVRYIGKLFWPADLAAYYSYPGMFGIEPWAWWQVGGSILILVLITLMAMWLARSRPYLIVGWLWYLGTLAPVIGVLQVGNQAMADRFSYIPYTGLFIMLAWSAADLAARFKWLRVPVAAAAAITIAACCMLTSWQVPVWRNADSLYTHTLAVTRNNYTIHSYYGIYLMRTQRPEEAETHLKRALELWSADSRLYLAYGMILTEQRRYYEAVAQLQKAIELNPDDAESHFRLGVALHRRGENGRAMLEIERAIELGSPDIEKYRAVLAQVRSAASHSE